MIDDDSEPFIIHSRNENFWGMDEKKKERDKDTERGKEETKYERERKEIENEGWDDKKNFTLREIELAKWNFCGIEW